MALLDLRRHLVELLAQLQVLGRIALGYLPESVAKLALVLLEEALDLCVLQYHRR